MCNIFKMNKKIIAKFLLSYVASRGKIKRIAFQFTPYSWVKFEWKPASNLRRWLAVLGIIFMVRNSLFIIDITKGSLGFNGNKEWDDNAVQWKNLEN